MRKRKNEPYFAEKEEQAVIDYISTDSKEEKNRIYNEILIEPFKKMIQSILRKYPIHIGNYDITEVESNALSHLLEQMVKYKQDTITKSGNKTKAFSYCQTIVRNYYKDHSKKSYSEKKINLSYEDYNDEFNNNYEYSYEMDHENNTEVLDKLIKVIIVEIDEKITTGNMKRNEIIVGDAIINILSNWEVLFIEDSPQGRYNKRVSSIFAKNKTLLFLKELTNLSTKEIRIAIKPFKELYFMKKYTFFN
jgi:hypothetical protein